MIRKKRLPVLLREILRATISTPLLLASTSCSSAGPDGVATCSTPPFEAGTQDDATADAAALTCLAYTLPVTGDPTACGLFPLDCRATAQAAQVTSPAVCAALCHRDGSHCYLASGNTVACTAGQCSGGACCGRRPPGLTLRIGEGKSVVGRWFAELSAREAASVKAFEILHRELAAHGAPRRLLARVREAARDEVRHARIMGAVASRYGGKPKPPRIEQGKIRSLEAIAMENAVEGCVRETFGALVGMWQARFAGDARVRRCMKGVAQDEARHAALSWAVARWIEPRLDDEARRKIRLAGHEAIATLEKELAADPAPEVVRVAGVPSANAAHRLLAQTRVVLWDGLALRQDALRQLHGAV